MKYIFIVLVLCVYINTIRPIFLEDSWRRLFGGDENRANSRKHLLSSKDAEVANKPYLQSLKSVNDDYYLDLENAIAAARSNVNIKPNTRLLRRKKHSRDNADVGSKLLNRLKVVKKPLARRKNANKRVDTKKSFFKKKKSLRRDDDDESTTSESSDREIGDLNDWKAQWEHEWLGKKVEALWPNMTTPIGDFVNMAAARPWGVPCGDPLQHDMPWGTCMLPMECEPEYRIYRGDEACEITQFVCCGVQLNVYDMYQGFDVSFADTSMATDLDDLDNEGSKNTAERKRRQESRDRKRREEERKKRKKRIRKSIQRVIRKINRILNKMYKNTRLDPILFLNKEFAYNDTFREIITNGTISKKAARMLSLMYPDLAPNLTIYTRKTGVADLNDKDDRYDVEYGFLYYLLKL